MSFWNWILGYQTCKKCQHHMLDRSKSLGFWILVCGSGRVSKPISVSREYSELSYKRPKWCPKR